MEPDGIRLSDYWRLVRENRNFRLLWFAQIISELGDWFYSVAVFSFLLETTGSAQTVAFAFVMQVLPQTLASPMAGVINDRLSRQRVMIFADWARAAIVLCMLLVQSRDRLWLLFVLLFLETVQWALFEPGRSAVVPNITSGKQTLVANALSSSTWSINFALGAAIGGLAAAFLGRQTVFVLNAISFMCSATLISRMRFEEPHLEHLPPFRFRDLFDFSPILEGARYIKSDARLLATIFVKGGLSLIGTNWVILPILGERIFPLRVGTLSESQAGTLGMSLLLGSRGAGALVGAVVCSSVAGQSARRLRMAILWGFGAAGLGYLLIQTAQNFWMAAAFLILAHAGGSAIWTASTTLLQQGTEDRYRGRVFSTEFAISMFVMSTTSYTAGIAVDAGVPVKTVAVWTGMALFVAGLVWFRALRLWR
jgi:MFS family permease